ncbi:ABC transporter permease [Rhodococcus xishaensis]|uniref:ABC transporter permease n=1 Tax=Rhodococcus xishaensis TaxID=2487364 RepID=A0A438AN48_9NOCA|nr:ABC transporter permease [Rhodococcus xishaensis]RVW00276.1 ABC transporter permease [Rhodococcus xishaensis]
MWASAWGRLRRRPMFWVAVAILLVVAAAALFPRLFTDLDPRYCNISDSLAPPRSGHWFGFDRQGCDIYARTVYGARPSTVVGVCATAAVLVVGVLFGSLAGYFGGWADSLLSRVTDIFFAIPFILAAIVLMQLFAERTIWTVVSVLALFGWPQMARIARGSVMSAKSNDYVLAARVVGMSHPSILVRHVLPNALAPIIVMATMSLGTFIVAEATLSFLGIGLPPTTVSWGGDISTAQVTLRSGSMILFYPAGALAIAVLGFILLGDALRDALDPTTARRK